MRENSFHLSDREIVMAADGELPAVDAARVEAHLAACSRCHERELEMRVAMSAVADAYHSAISAPPEGLRARLETRLANIAALPLPVRRITARSWVAPAVLAASVIFVAMMFVTAQERRHEVVLDIPDPSLTPGVAVLEPANRLCTESLPKNKDVPSSVRRRVMQEYGLADASPRAYEVDYLVTPALGGTDDVRNLWPHSYSHTRWNAAVKDALEDKLHSLVCEGKVDLPTAQTDIATNWIGAYRKYFHSDPPLEVQ